MLFVKYIWMGMLAGAWGVEMALRFHLILKRTQPHKCAAVRRGVRLAALVSRPPFLCSVCFWAILCPPPQHLTTSVPVRQLCAGH